jgi:hypothetical protein
MDTTQARYVTGIDSATLRFLAEALDDQANVRHAWEAENGPKKMRHAGSALLRLWADRFQTEANRLEDGDVGSD